MYICSILAPCLKAFALTGRGDSTMREPQGVASLALGYVLHWAFSPPLLNPELETKASNYTHERFLKIRTCHHCWHHLHGFYNGHDEPLYVHYYGHFEQRHPLC